MTDWVALAALTQLQTDEAADWRGLPVPVFCRKLIGRLYWKRRWAVIKTAGECFQCRRLFWRLYWSTDQAMQESCARSWNKALLSWLHGQARVRWAESGWMRRMEHVLGADGFTVMASAWIEKEIPGTDWTMTKSTLAAWLPEDGSGDKM